VLSQEKCIKLFGKIQKILPTLALPNKCLGGGRKEKEKEKPQDPSV
jgi:hypothetical protein